MTERPSISMRPIGIIHSPLTDEDAAPIQSSRSDFEGVLEIYPEFEPGLEGIEGFSHIFLLYCFFETGNSASLQVTPFLDNRKRGIFSTRFPLRPNPIGLSVVQLVRREKTRLFLKGVDMLDGTLVLDIKPYLPDFDIFQTDKIGWFKNRSKS
jgi:tRNA-Thr(GGU) m(6)t(6)A37 methyltransferase TsaA